MADRTSIEWTATVHADGTVTPGSTWQITTGCTVVSPGCTNCYAMRLAGTRLQHHPSRKGLTQDTKAGPVWNGEVRFNEQWLDQPLRWKAPRRIFVSAHGDIFHESVPDEWIDKVFAVMALAPQHTFQILTKRAARMREYHEHPDIYPRVLRAAESLRSKRPELCRVPISNPKDAAFWPHVWRGVSVEDQARADERIPDLLATPAAVRFISAEPLLGPLDIRRWLPGHRCPFIDWVIVGGESGPKARPIHPDWPRSLRDQCQAAGVSFFFKQWGEWLPTTEVGSSGRGGFGEYPRAPKLAMPPALMQRVGKKAAGRLLDGHEWNEMPGG